MARYEHLPIYKKAMDVAVYFEKAVAGFGRYLFITISWPWASGQETGSQIQTPQRDEKCLCAVSLLPLEVSGDILFFQVGRFFEFYHAHDNDIARLFGLSRMQKNPRGAKYGFPISLINRYFQALLKQNASIVLIPEREQYWTGIKERAPAYRFECLARVGRA
jgi:hypothetical protein